MRKTHETADGRTFVRTTVTDGRQPGWCVSYTTGDGIDGAELHVYRSRPEEPNQWGGRGTIERHPLYYGMTFPDVDAAASFALTVGLLRPYLTIYGADGRLVG